LQGPKIRVGSLEGGQPIKLVDGNQVTISTHPAAGDPSASRSNRVARCAST
jgi:pyruvate kinase